MDDYNALVFVEKTEWADDWKDAPGRWSLTNHAEVRLRERYQLDDDAIIDMIEGLERENLVRVPNRRERENTYTVQTTVGEKGLFLVVAGGSKTIITVMTPFFRFPGEITSDRLEVQLTDYTWPAQEEGFKLDRPTLEKIIDTNPPTEGTSPEEDYPTESLGETELYKRGLQVANARIKELERQICAIRCICGTALEGGKR